VTDEVSQASAPSRVLPEPVIVQPFADDGARWDAFVGAAEHSTFCHLAGWREIMTDVLGHECPYLVAADEQGAWRGVLPLVRVRSRLFGHYLVSMPFLNYGGPLGTPAAQHDLVQAAVGLARRSSADLLELRTRHSVGCELRVSHRKITVVLELPDSADVLWREVLPSSRRRQVSRAQKEGMQTRFGPDQVEPFYQVFAVNMRDLGTPVLPRRLFERIARVFGEAAVFGVVYWRGQPLAAGCGFVWGSEFEITWVSSLRQYDHKMPNMLLYWSFMKHLISQGVRVFNFGRCTPGGRTHQFKHQWGGVDTALPWLQWSPRQLDATPTPERPLYHMAAALWRRIPVRLANRVGPVLARRLP